VSELVLSVRDLWKRYARAEPVLRGVDLSVPAGSFAAVLGVSGCGKTTLLRAIAGFERIERGRIELGERTLDDDRVHLAPERRSVGYVPQDGALFPNLDVRANVGFGLSRARRRTRAVDELLELVGLAAHARRHPHQLSGGEQQRVSLARALAREPAVVLLDEPFSALDASLRASVREEVGALLRRQGATTVLVTHDQEEALSLADSVAVLRDGAVVQHGTPAELYAAPADAGVATFVGAANVLDATFDGAWAHTIVGRLPLRERAPAGGDAGTSRVVIRPEQLRLALDGSGGEVAEGARGTVERCLFYGHDALLHVRLLASPQAPALLVRVVGGRELVAGAPVLVSASGEVTAVA
jgi:iron(III) transport system ATP-binding protein